MVGQLEAGPTTSASFFALVDMRLVEIIKRNQKDPGFDGTSATGTRVGFPCSFLVRE